MAFTFLPSLSILDRGACGRLKPFRSYQEAAMMFTVICLVAVVLFCILPCKAHAALYRVEDLILLDKEKLAGGEGVVKGRYSFTRDTPPPDHAVKEIAWLTLEPGHSIGLHKHETNEDVYVIVSGNGVLTDADGKDYPVNPGDIMVARKGDSHALRNSGGTPLVFVSMIAE